MTTFQHNYLLNILHPNIYLKLTYEWSMSSSKLFECHDLIIWVTRDAKIMMKMVSTVQNAKE